jgi:hypothetical protein
MSAHTTPQRQVERMEQEREETENLSEILAVICAAFGVLLFILFVEIFDGKFLLSCQNNERGTMVQCLCCDLWPLKYIRFLKRR